MIFALYVQYVTALSNNMKSFLAYLELPTYIVYYSGNNTPPRVKKTFANPVMDICGGGRGC